MINEKIKKIGNISQLAGIQQSVLSRGTGKGLEIVEMYNEKGLSLSILPDRCMDIRKLTYKGMNISFETKNGPTSNFLASSNPKDFASQWPGGMLFTCGLDNVGKGSSEDVLYPTHGRIWAKPSEQLELRKYWENGEFILEAKGDIHQTKLNGEHLQLNRTIKVKNNSSCFYLNDELTNLEEKDEKIMLLYHFNFGYPFLDENSYLEILNSEITDIHDTPDKYPITMGKPKDNYPEECFFYKNTSQTSMAMLINPDTNIAAYIKFDTTNLPNLLIWKNVKSHDYVLAIEPCNCLVKGREFEEKNGNLRIIKAGETLNFEIEFGILEGKDEILQFKGKMKCQEK